MRACAFAQLTCLRTLPPLVAGENFDRKSVCYDPEASAVVQVTDVCPCNYPDNYYR